MINPIDILAPMLRDLAVQNGLTVDETAVTEARNYCEEMIPMPVRHRCEHRNMRREQHWDECVDCGARWSPEEGWGVPMGPS
jgi:hypothetical protein